MKTRKRCLALTAAALVAFSLTGCGEETVTAEGLLAAVRKNLSEASSLEGALAAEIRVRTTEAMGAAEADSQEGEVRLNGEMQATDSGWTHLTADLEMISAGQMQQGSAELYLEEEADRRNCYLSLDGSWEYQELPAAEEPAFRIWNRLWEGADGWSLEEETQEEEGQEVYVLTASASFQDWGLAALGDSVVWGQVQDLLTGLDCNPEEIPVKLTCLISQEEQFPLRLEVRTENALAVTQEKSPLYGTEVEVCLTWSGISRNTVESLTIPEDAQAAETAPETLEPGFSTEGEMVPDTGLEGEIQLEEEFPLEE